MIECGNISFPIIFEYVSKPHHLTSKSYEHTFFTLRGMIREFTIIEFCHIIKKLDYCGRHSLREQLKSFDTMPPDMEINIIQTIRRRKSISI